MNDILVVDDSALMRRLICDIIGSVQGFRAPDSAFDAKSAMGHIRTHSYSCICYNVCMASDRAGKDIFTMMREEGVKIPVIGMCYPTELDKARSLKGPVTVVVHPYRMASNDTDTFAEALADALMKYASAGASEPATTKNGKALKESLVYHPKGIVVPNGGQIPVSKRGEIRNNYKGKFAKYPFQLVAIASSTGGPQALHNLIPMIPKDFPVPIVIVQHMPKGFTDSLAKRITEYSQIPMKEAVDGEELKAATAYIAPGGRHFEVYEESGILRARVYDGEPVNNLRPCADVMYESLKYISVPDILCAVLTGMGADGTEGIKSLRKEKHLYVITQDQNTCVVYGMPKAAYSAGLSDEQQPIGSIANSIARKLGV